MEHFSKLNTINVNDHTEQKDGLTYLSWAWAWAEVKKVYPDATYTIKRFDGKPYLFDEELGYMVFTEMTIEGHTHEMWLPVMNGAKKAMKNTAYTYEVKKYEWDQVSHRNVWKGAFEEKVVEAATMFDINTAIMRCLTKNIAMFGLGLYIYAGEDLPESEDGDDSDENGEQKPPKKVIQMPKTGQQRQQGQSGSSGLTLEQAKKLAFKNGKNAGVPFEKLEDSTLEWCVNNMSGTYADGARMVLDSRKATVD